MLSVKYIGGITVIFSQCREAGKLFYKSIHVNKLLKVIINC